MAKVKTGTSRRAFRRRRLARPGLGALAWLLISVLPLAAHHSDSEAAADQVVTVQGEIRDIRFVNPHVVLVLATATGDLYRVVWAEPRRLVRLGVSESALHTGDRITIVASPSRDSRDRTLSLVRDVRRASDGWHWNRGATVID